MKRELANENDGFESLEEAIAFCNKRDAIIYAKIGKAKRFHVIIGAFEHWSQYYEWVAIYEVVPKITIFLDND